MTVPVPVGIYGFPNNWMSIISSRSGWPTLAEWWQARFCSLVASNAARSIYQTDRNFWPATLCHLPLISSQWHTCPQNVILLPALHLSKLSLFLYISWSWDCEDNWSNSYLEERLAISGGPGSDYPELGEVYPLSLNWRRNCRLLINKNQAFNPF